MILQRLKNWIKTSNAFHAIMKQYYCLKYVSKYKKRKIHIPTQIFIETTNFCNSNCKMCPHRKMKREKGYMSQGLFEKIINECKSFETKRLQFLLQNQGEPLLDTLLFRRIEYIKKNLFKSKIILNSNAMLLDENKAKQILDLGVDRVIFSVDGASQETYEEIREGLKYDVVKRNIEYFLKLKKDNAYRTKAIMQMVVCDRNKHEIDKYKELWLEKVDEIHFKPMHSFLDMETSIKTKFLRTKQLAFCESPYEVMIIYWNGDIGLCCWDYDNEAKIGNIENDSLINIYNNNKYQMIRALMNRMDCRTISPCNRCSLIYGKDTFRFFKWEGLFRS